MTPPILELQDIQVLAGPRTLLEVPSFHLQAGETVSLVGPNGSGKTTFLHTAAFLRPPDAGQVTFAGLAVNTRNAASLRRRTSIVFQDPLLFSIDVLRNAAAGLRFHGVPGSEAQRRALDFLDLFGVAHLANRKPRGLSGGEAARVALARAFATDPDLLLLDEPFRALDAGSRAILLPELRERLTERGAAAILVTHDIAEAFAFAPRLVLLDGGGLIADGDVRTLTLRPPSRRAAILLGVENVMPGLIVGYEHGLGRVEIAPGTYLLATCDRAPHSGSKVEVTVPATMMRLFPATEPIPDGWNGILAGVESVATQPGWDLVTLHAGGATLWVRETWASAAGTRWSAGDSLTAAFPPDTAWIIPGEGTGGSTW
ncbi:MAG: ABC transporter ATP-binding protein [Chloroflexota bacterium]|nr:ABC transporter ATP-binding protein [Chloroflexota bacterium]